jgi:hypothetical protein
MRFLRAAHPTYIKVRGNWTYLDRAIDSNGGTVQFWLQPSGSCASRSGVVLAGPSAWSPAEEIPTRDRAAQAHQSYAQCIPNRHERDSAFVTME